MNQEYINTYSLGMIGLGTMGRNLLLNLADNGFNVTGYDRSTQMVEKLEEEGEAYHLKAFNDIQEFIASIRTPRTIMLLVPAGPIVDSVLEELKPLLSEGDVIIDSGNSHFTDTARRAEALALNNLHFFGMGISGGEEGARKGPSMMPGGDKQAYNVVKQMLESVAAKVDGVPCVTYIGPGASGHFVKMVHNGIEYALMQLIAETYDILKNAYNYSNLEISALFEKWNKGRLQSFLIEITKEIFQFKDVSTGQFLVDLIKDEAMSKGTGKWTSQIAMDLEVPIPTIDAAVSTRNLSKLKSLRTTLSQANRTANSNKNLPDLDSLESAFFFTMSCAYAQGMHLLQIASNQYQYNLDLKEIAKIWRGGCIIRAAYLNTIYNAYSSNSNILHLFENETVQEELKTSFPGIKKIIFYASETNIALPAYASALAYYNTLSTENMPSNLTQAQRDFFGAHTYQRRDKPGIFHADWNGLS